VGIFGLTYGAKTYTYRDPEGGLLPGDLVEVPTGPGNTPAVGRVIALDRGRWVGPVKDVRATFTRHFLR